MGWGPNEKGTTSNSRKVTCKWVCPHNFFSYEKEKAEQIKKKQEEEEKQDTDEAYDTQTLKDRDTDEWKDSTPKGIGNKNDNYFRRS